ncbi:MAG: MBL fold metallo-hydrolase [Candidatus Omnitrophica bacterium]|nr:MBL fold metallo-hydrolase [Candidatus Omnitrophota bacterium]
MSKSEVQNSKFRPKNKPTEFIKFLGTAGARFVMIRQLRASGGLWIRACGKNILVDPGPGSIVRCASSRPKIDPSILDAIILTHRHLDHANDINVMIEAMTEGGFKKKGVVFCPGDALDEDPVILKHVRNFPERFEVLKENSSYKIGDFEFQTGVRHIHPCETYGLKFKLGSKSMSLVGDTKYFQELAGCYKADIIILPVVFFEPRPGVDHLSLPDAEILIQTMKPEMVILTHFGMTMLKAKPHIQAEMLKKKLGIDVVAAYDGMTLEF